MKTAAKMKAAKKATRKRVRTPANDESWGERAWLAKWDARLGGSRPLLRNWPGERK